MDVQRITPQLPRSPPVAPVPYPQDARDVRERRARSVLVVRSQRSSDQRSSPRVRKVVAMAFSLRPMQTSNTGGETSAPAAIPIRAHGGADHERTLRPPTRVLQAARRRRILSAAFLRGRIDEAAWPPMTNGPDELERPSHGHHRMLAARPVYPAHETLDRRAGTQGDGAQRSASAGDL